MTKSIDNPKESNLLGIFDLTDPIKNVYLSVLKIGIVSLDDFINIPENQLDKTEAKIYLDILVRQNYLGKYKDNNIIMYKVKGLKRKARVVPSSIWDKLDST